MTDGATIRLEHLWNERVKSYDVDVFCGYPLGSFQGGMGSHIFEKLHARYIQASLPMKRTLRRASQRHAAGLFASRCNSISETGEEFRVVI